MWEVPLTLVPRCPPLSGRLHQRASSSTSWRRSLVLLDELTQAPADTEADDAAGGQLFRTGSAKHACAPKFLDECAVPMYASAQPLLVLDPFNPLAEEADAEMFHDKDTWNMSSIRRSENFNLPTVGTPKSDADAAAPSEPLATDQFSSTLWHASTGMQHHFSLGLVRRDAEGRLISLMRWQQLVSFPRTVATDELSFVFAVPRSQAHENRVAVLNRHAV